MNFWLFFAFAALFLYGLGQGFVKKWISEVPPARFCLYFVLAKALVNFGFFFSSVDGEFSRAIFEMKNIFLKENFFLTGLFAYTLDGLGWIFYFESIVSGPITIVGTLSAAYPALTVLAARFFLGEQLSLLQYTGVFFVIAGCLGLAYSPAGNETLMTEKKSSRWIFFAAAALFLWASAQTLVKYAYHLPGAHENDLAILNTMGGFLTLGSYGILFELILKKSKQKIRQQSVEKFSMKNFFHSALPMGMMAGGDLCVLLATKTGPISIVTPLTGAYPMVTLGFARLVLKERITPLQWMSLGLILLGMILSPM